MKKRRRSRRLILLWIIAATLWCHFSIHGEDWVISSQRIPAAFDGYRITLLTDIHGRQFGDNDAKLLEAVRQAKPDLIAIGGDLLDEYTDSPVPRPLLTGLAAIAPTCYVTGNHEWAMDDTEEVLRQIESCGVTVLRNDYLLLEQCGERLILAGAEDRNGYADMEQPDALMARIRAEVGGDPYTAVLYHRNDSLSLWAELEADLVLCGHGHGGIVRLPFIGGLLGVDREFFPDDEAGLYTEGRTTMAVSRGLGGMRLWNRPHLPTLVLRHR